MEPCVISVADHAGWAHLLVVAAVDGVPAVIDRRRVALIEPGLPTMPYHHESLVLEIAAADALIARVRQSVEVCATHVVNDVIRRVSSRYRVAGLAIRPPTYPALPDTVALVRPSYALQCAADGMLYTLALCAAARQAGLDVHQCRRGEEAARAAACCHATPDAVEAFTRTTGRPAGSPWTDEHRRAFAAGMAALAVHSRHLLALSGAAGHPERD